MKKQALSLIEVIIAMVIISIIIVALMPAFSASLKQTTIAGQKGQAIRFMEFLGRLAVTGDVNVLPGNSETQKSWDYGELSNSFIELYSPGQDITSPEKYRATITKNGTVSLSGVSSIQYDLEVCFMKTGEEYCQRASTFGPAVSTGSSIDYLPGIN